MNSGGTSGHTEEPFASKEHTNVCQYLQPNSTCRRDRKDTARSRSRIRRSDHCIAPGFCRSRESASRSSLRTIVVCPRHHRAVRTRDTGNRRPGTGQHRPPNLGRHGHVHPGRQRRASQRAKRAGWGVRQITTGATLWAALLLGDEVLFQVGLGSVVIRQCLDIVANLLDRRPLGAVPYIALAVPTIAALLQVL